VLSPSTAKLDRSRKQRIYARAGVRHLWLVDPRFRTAEVMRLHEGKWLTLAVHTDDERVRAEPFDAIELELAVLWSDLGAFGTRVSEPGALYEHDVG
jgi:Uma2 family endonuclease